MLSLIRQIRRGNLQLSQVFDFALSHATRLAGSQALNLYHRALELNPKDHRVYNNIGAIYNIQARDEDSYRVLTKSLELDPFGESSLVNLANYHSVSVLLMLMVTYNAV